MSGYIPILQWDKKHVQISNLLNRLCIIIPVVIYDKNGYPHNKKKISDPLTPDFSRVWEIEGLQDRARVVIMKKITESIESTSPAFSCGTFINKLIGKDSDIVLGLNIDGFPQEELILKVNIPLDAYYGNEWFANYIDSMPR